MNNITIESIENIYKLMIEIKKLIKSVEKNENKLFTF